jgi:hypothetical protein
LFKNHVNHASHDVERHTHNYGADHQCLSTTEFGIDHEERHENKRDFDTTIDTSGKHLSFSARESNSLEDLRSVVVLKKIHKLLERQHHKYSN